MEAKKFFQRVVVPSLFAVSITACASLSTTDAQSASNFTLPTETPTTVPTSAPSPTTDPALTAPYYCGTVEKNLTDSVKKTLIDQTGDKLSLTDLYTANWYIAMIHAGNRYVDLMQKALSQPTLDNKDNLRNPFGLAAKYDPYCFSSLRAAAAIRVHVSP